jgi:hypothetical protein
MKYVNLSISIAVLVAAVAIASTTPARAGGDGAQEPGAFAELFSDGLRAMLR